MGYKVDELIESMKAEESAGGTPPAETQTPPAEDTPKGNEEQPQETPPAEPKPGEDDDNGGNGGEPTKPKEDDRFSRAEFSFRRKLEKASRKHAEDLAERDKKYNELLAQFEELKKTVAPKEPTKKREDFASDDEYIDYLVQQRTAKELDKFRETLLTPHQLEAAKKQIRGQLTVDCDNRENYALDFGSVYLFHNKTRELSTMFRDIDAVTAEDIQRVAQTVFDLDKMTTLIYK